MTTEELSKLREYATSPSFQAQAEAAFNSYDSNADGHISLDEVRFATSTTQEGGRYVGKIYETPRVLMMIYMTTTTLWLWSRLSLLILARRQSRCACLSIAILARALCAYPMCDSDNRVDAGTRHSSSLLYTNAHAHAHNRCPCWCMSPLVRRSARDNWRKQYESGREALHHLNGGQKQRRQGTRLSPSILPRQYGSHTLTLTHTHREAIAN